MFNITQDNLEEFRNTLSEQFVVINDDNSNEYIYENIQFEQNFPKVNFTDNEMFIKFNNVFLRLITKTLSESYTDYSCLRAFDIQTVDNEEFIKVIYRFRIGKVIA